MNEENAASTPDEEPAGEESLDSAIDAALENFDESGDSKAEEAEAVASQPEPEEAEEVEVEEVEDGAEFAPSEGEASEVAGVEPPEHWAQEDKDRFSALPADSQDWLMGRHRDLEADYTKKTQEIADVRKTAEAFQQAVSPYEAMIRSEGSDPLTAVQNLLGTAYALRTGTPQQRQALISQMAQVYGADLESLATESGEDEYVDPHVAQLSQQVQSLQQQVGQYQGAAVQQAQASNQAMIEQFALETDADGKPLRPHFEAVRERMAGDFMARQGTVTDLNKALSDAYEAAVWADPELRSKMLAEQKAADTRVQEQQRKESVAKAKKAGRGVRQRSTGTPNAPKNLDDLLSQALDDAGIGLNP